MYPGFAFLSVGTQLHLEPEKQENTPAAQREGDSQGQTSAFGQTLNWLEMDAAGLVVTWRVLLYLSKALILRQGEASEAPALLTSYMH